LLDNGGVKCWGDNAYGELGLGDINNRGDAPGEMGDALPFVDVGSGLTVTEVSIGLDHSCVFIDGGQVKCWGSGASGQSGVGDTVPRGDGPGEMGDALPFVQLAPGATVQALHSGSSHVCAILTDGELSCWGFNVQGQTGLGLAEAWGDAPEEVGDGMPVVSLW
jgi:alpha-tubulin suppressor-like RCC1 family protein